MTCLECRRLLQRDHAISSDEQRALKRGAETVEALFVLPLFLAMTFTIIDGSLMIFEYETMVQSARQGARYAMVRGRMRRALEA